MPTYEYTCIKCDKSVEMSGVNVDDRDHQVCNECGDILKRSWTLGNVSVWAPTAGGFR